MRVRVKVSQIAQQRGRSLNWIAKKTGKGYRTIWDFANEKRGAVYYEVLESVCAALECEPGDLLVLEKGKKREARKGRGREEI